MARLIITVLIRGTIALFLVSALLSGAAWLGGQVHATPTVTVQLQPNDQVGGIVAAAESVAQEYNTIPFTITSRFLLPVSTYAGAKPGWLIINRTYSTDPVDLDNDFAYDVSHNFHNPGCPAQTYIGYHEAAHQIDYTRGMRARLVVQQKYGVGLNLRSELSQYSFSEGSLDAAESLAEAFAAIKCEPKTATPTEWDLYRILITS